MLRERKPCLHIKYKRIHCLYKYKELKVHNGSSDHDRTSTCLNITYKKMISESEIWSWSLMSKIDANSVFEKSSVHSELLVPLRLVAILEENKLKLLSISFMTSR